MKTEQAIQQVLTAFNGHELQEDGSLMVSDFDGLGEIEQHFDALRDSIRNKERSIELRKHAKDIAAKAMRFMVDRT